jgi:hypothetical protein
VQLRQLSFAASAVGDFLVVADGVSLGEPSAFAVLARQADSYPFVGERVEGEGISRRPARSAKD